MSHDAAEQAEHGERDDPREHRHGQGHGHDHGHGHGHLVVVQATRCDLLAADLAQRLNDAEFSHPLDECIVVLQGAGMHRWLRREMAFRLGAWGGVETPFLRKFLFDVTSRGSAEPLATSNRQDIQELAYRIAAHAASASASASAVASGRALNRIEPFLAASRDTSGKLQMDTLLTHSHTLAESFDRYEMDRPDMIASWELRDAAWRDPVANWSDSAIMAESWQRALWREVVPGCWKPHDVWKEFYALIKVLESGECPEALKSIRFVSVFGVSTLPPSVFAFLEALARYISVQVHLLVPTEALMDEGASDRKIAKHAARAGTDIATFRDTHKRDEHNALRVTLGAAAFEAAKVIDGFAGVEEHLCESAPVQPTTLLAAVQQALREDRPARKVLIDAATTDAKPDVSVQFHSVSTAARAAEVVHDEVLRACADFPGLLQEEIAILVPTSLASYGSAIEALFERRAIDMPADSRLSLHNADASAGDQSPLAAAVMSMMALVIEDAAFAQVYALLSSAVVCDAMGHEIDEVRKQLDLLSEACASRFYDAAHRQRWLGKSDRADDALHTIAWATDRVILGTVAGDSPAQNHAIGSLRASNRVEGQATDVFHAIGARIDALQAFAIATTQEPQTIEAWAQQLEKLCDLFLPDASDAHWGEQRVQIGSVLATIAQLSSRAELPPVDFAVARCEFAKEFENITEGGRFASGGVTLARLSPMRSVPFRFIALVGVDKGIFPRPFKRNLMDIESLCPRAGDRNACNDDLLLLLESIHAATDRLIIVYEGIEPSTSRAKPASPVIEQLLETCAGHLGISDAEAKTRLCRTHTPMADQPDAWLESAPAGFDAKARERAEKIAVALTNGSVRSFMDAPSATVTGATATTTATTRVEIPSIERMGSVLTDPVRAFVESSGLKPADLGKTAEAIAEPIELNKLESFHTRKLAVQRYLEGVPPKEIREELRINGMLPHGASGSIVWNGIAQLAAAAREKVGRHFQDLNAPLRDGWRCVTGTDHVIVNTHPLAWESFQIEDAATQVLVMRDGKWGDQLPLWLQHLAWCATYPQGKSILVTIGPKGRVISRTPVDVGLAAETLDAVGLWTTAALTELMPFNGKLLHPWIGGPKQKKTPEEQLKRAEKEFYKEFDFDLNIPLAFRGQDFFKYHSRGAKPQTFVDIAEWLAAQLRQTGWEK